MLGIYCAYAYHAMYTVYEHVMNMHVVEVHVVLTRYTQYMNIHVMNILCISYTCSIYSSGLRGLEDREGRSCTQNDKEQC